MIIKKTGEIFSSNTREEDIVARIGGDEFAVILPETGSNSACKLINRIKNKCRKCNQNDKLSDPLQISLGHATMTKKEEDSNEIFDKADKNMYEKKGAQTGKSVLKIIFFGSTARSLKTFLLQYN